MSGARRRSPWASSQPASTSGGNSRIASAKAVKISSTSRAPSRLSLATPVLPDCPLERLVQPSRNTERVGRRTRSDQFETLFSSHPLKRGCRATARRPLWVPACAGTTIFTPADRALEQGELVARLRRRSEQTGIEGARRPLAETQFAARALETQL